VINDEHWAGCWKNIKKGVEDGSIERIGKTGGQENE
jgi:hypothetical protein